MADVDLEKIVKEAVESVLGRGGGRGCVPAFARQTAPAAASAAAPPSAPAAAPGPAFAPPEKKPGVCLLKGVEAGLKQFDLVPGVNARLVDLVNASNGCSMAVGLMELRECTFDWTLNYEEVDYVLDGVLDIVVGERTWRAFKGDAIFIPKGTSIKFSTPSRALFVYATYPADWANQ